jgi:hypothetical protein
LNEVVVQTKDSAPLDELMLAMDVVDTLRHQELVLARELEADDRDERLLERLREIYTAQGIEVTDEVLAQGVKALREERFVYPGPAPSFGRTLATLYVTRARWGKWVGGLTTLVVVGLLAFQLFVRGPELRAIEALPVDLQSTYQDVAATTDDAAALSDARALLAAGETALAGRNYDGAREAVASLRALDARLKLQYDLTIVSRPNEVSGFWRIPDANTGAQNFYLVVEAIAPNGEALRLPIRNEETQRVERVRRWGLRVDEETFGRVAADKRDDGIIQQNVVGMKQRGSLEPEYSIATTGAAVTEWE